MKLQWVVTVASVGALGGLLLGAGLPVLREPAPVAPIEVVVPATDERPRAAGDRGDENVQEGDDGADDNGDDRGERDDAAAGDSDGDSDGTAGDDLDGPQRNPVSGGGDDDTAADDGDDHGDDADD